MAKNKTYAKDQLVYTRKSYGEDAGQVDTEHMYKIAKIGPKMATLMRVDPKTGEPYYHRGHNLYLHDREDAERRNQNNGSNNWRSVYFWDWSQCLVAISNAGWDPDMNF